MKAKAWQSRVIALALTLFAIVAIPMGTVWADDGIDDAKGKSLDYDGAPTEWLETEADTPT
jgi:hypothetical protein